MAKVKKPKSKARKIIEWVLVSLVGALFLVAAAGQIESMVHKDQYFSQPIRLGVGIFQVKTNSMEPEYKVGCGIITFREDPEQIYASYQKGETIDITFMDRCLDEGTIYEPSDKVTHNFRTDPTGVPMTHRVFEVHVDETKAKWQGRYVFFVAGINPEGQKSNPGQYQAFSDRYILGRVVHHSDFLGAVTDVVASPIGLFLLLLIPAFYLVIVSVIDIFKAVNAPAEVTDGQKKEAVSIEGLSEADKKRLKQEMLEQMLAKKAEEKAKKEAELQEKPIEKEGEDHAE